MTPQSSKAKGRRAQQWVRDYILSLFPKLTTDDVRSTSMGATGEDIQLSSAAREYVPFQIEVKNKAASQVHTYMNQAREHGPHEPLVIVKKDRDIYLAIISAEYFFKMLQELNGFRDSQRVSLLQPK